jgi:hypothetical protein
LRDNESDGRADLISLIWGIWKAVDNVQDIHLQSRDFGGLICEPLKVVRPVHAGILSLTYSVDVYGLKKGLGV